MDGSDEGYGGGPRYITNCTDTSGRPASLEARLLDDGHIEISIGPSGTGVLTSKQVGRLRGQLADLIADGLRGVRWEDPSPGGFSNSGPGVLRVPLPEEE